MIELSENISDYILRNFGQDYLNQFCEHYLDDYNTYLRLPNDINSHDEITTNLFEYGIELEQHSNIPIAYKVLSGHEKIGKTLEYTIGKYYIQSLSSMIPPIVLNPKNDEIILDMCAAPGSKSTQLAEMLNNRGTLYANEPSSKRVKSLVYNMDRMGLANMGIIQKPGELLSKKFDHYFDKILVDAPCSGLGIVQKKGEISNWWTEKSVDRISETQLKLIISAIKTAKVGAEIIYSTCTLTFEENELILNKLLRKYPVELVDIDLPLPSHPAFTEFEGEKLNPQIEKARRIIAWEVGSEGFFVAKLIKIDKTEPAAREERRTTRNLQLVKATNREVKDSLKYISDYYGIPMTELNRFRYIVKSRDLGFISEDWLCDEPNNFVRIGTKFCTVDKSGRSNLNSLAIQTLGPHIKKKLVELNSEEQFKTYITGGIIKSITHLHGSQVVKYKKYFLGTAVGTKEGLKSQYPRSMRTHEIMVP